MILTEEQKSTISTALKAKGLFDHHALAFLAKACPNPRGRPLKYHNSHRWAWSQSDVELSRQHAISVGTVRNIRRRLGKPLVLAPNNPSRLLEERRQWDWSKTDAEVGRAHEISRERARQIRLQLGLPSSRPNRTMAEEKFLAWVGGRKSIVHADAVHAGFEGSGIRFWCELNGIERTLSKMVFHPRWDATRINWELPNWAIEEAWGMTRNSAASLRCRQGKSIAPYILKRERATIEPLINLEKQKSKA